ncbi:amidase [Pseudomonas phage vB_PpuM-Lauda]
MISEVTIHCSGTEKMTGFSWLEFLNSQTMKSCQSDPKRKCSHTGLFIDFHYLILPNGNVINGRDDRSIGMHTPNKAQGNLGICLIGGLNNKGEWVDNFTPVQKESLCYLLDSLVSKYRIPITEIRGAKEHPQVEGQPPTESPCFDVQDLVQSLQGVPYGFVTET